MAKYSEKFKMKVVREYQHGKLSYRSLAQKYNIGSDGQIVRWVKLYEKFGIEGLMTQKNKETFTVQFKLDVLSFIKKTGSSEIETALHFGLKNPPLIAAWKKVFAEGGIEALNRLRGRPPMSDKAKNSKNKPLDEKELTYEQQLQKENELLRLEVEYLKKLRAFQMDPENYLEKHKQRYHTNSRKRSD